MTATQESQCELEVAEAARALVTAFSNFDRDSYFACFTEDADFIFYNSDVTFSARSEYESAWSTWVEEGWRVRKCESLNPRIRIVDDQCAIFAHEVFTALDTSDGALDMHERETIVFAKRGSQWLAIHEHLSSYPSPELTA
jgi:ketosteroid isomerase-like protein